MHRFPPRPRRLSSAPIWSQAVASLGFAARKFAALLADYYRVCGTVSWLNDPPCLRTIWLRRDELLRFTARSGVRRLEVRQGSVWLTETPGETDILLERGSQFALSKDRWPVIVQATEDAELTVRRQH